MPHIGRPSNTTKMAAALLVLIVVSRPAHGTAQEVPSTTAAQHRDENGEAIGRADSAVVLTLTYTSDVNADVSGGEHTGTAYLQRVGLIGDVDLARAIRWSGATAHVSIHSITGTGLSGSQVGNLLTVSGIEASPALRLFNLWVEQKLGSAGSLRIGQFTAGQNLRLAPPPTH